MYCLMIQMRNTFSHFSNIWIYIHVKVCIYMDRKSCLSQFKPTPPHLIRVKVERRYHCQKSVKQTSSGRDSNREQLQI